MPDNLDIHNSQVLTENDQEWENASKALRNRLSDGEIPGFLNRSFILELLFQIFSYLTPAQLCKASLVCKDWHTLSFVFYEASQEGKKERQLFEKALEQAQGLTTLKKLEGCFVKNTLLGPKLIGLPKEIQPKPLQNKEKKILRAAFSKLKSENLFDQDFALSIMLGHIEKVKTYMSFLLLSRPAIVSVLEEKQTAHQLFQEAYFASDNYDLVKKDFRIIGRTAIRFGHLEILKHLKITQFFYYNLLNLFINDAVIFDQIEILKWLCEISSLGHLNILINEECYSYRAIVVSGTKMLKDEPKNVSSGHLTALLNNKVVFLKFFKGIEKKYPEYAAFARVILLIKLISNKQMSDIVKWLASFDADYQLKTEFGKHLKEAVLKEHSLMILKYALKSKDLTVIQTITNHLLKYEPSLNLSVLDKWDRTHFAWNAVETQDLEIFKFVQATISKINPDFNVIYWTLPSFFGILSCNMDAYLSCIIKCFGDTFYIDFLKCIAEEMEKESDFYARNFNKSGFLRNFNDALTKKYEGNFSNPIFHYILAFAISTKDRDLLRNLFDLNIYPDVKFWINIYLELFPKEIERFLLQSEKLNQWLTELFPIDDKVLLSQADIITEVPLIYYINQADETKVALWLSEFDRPIKFQSIALEYVLKSKNKNNFNYIASHIQKHEPSFDFTSLPLSKELKLMLNICESEVDQHKIDVHQLPEEIYQIQDQSSPMTYISNDHCEKLQNITAIIQKENTRLNRTWGAGAKYRFCQQTLEQTLLLLEQKSKWSDQQKTLFLGLVMLSTFNKRRLPSFPFWNPTPAKSYNTLMSYLGNQDWAKNKNFSKIITESKQEHSLERKTEMFWADRRTYLIENQEKLISQMECENETNIRSSIFYPY